MKKLSLYVLCASLPLTVISCAKSGSSSASSSAQLDSSTSGTAASSVGGAIANSDVSGTVAKNDALKRFWSMIIPEAYASNACPTLKTAAGKGCTQASNAADLTYVTCDFGNAGDTWTGTMQISLSAGTAVTCGTFPTLSSIPNGQSLQRQFVTSGAPGTALRTTASVDQQDGRSERIVVAGRSVTIDHKTANLANFDSATISANIGTGYGTQVVFDGSGHRKQVIVNERVYDSTFDHSVSGSINMSESGSTRTISSGTVKVYHNTLKVVGTSSFSNVVYNDKCCTPVSGTITTTYAAGTHVSTSKAGSAMVGKSEKLEFLECGSAILTNTAGQVSNVSMNTCY